MNSNTCDLYFNNHGKLVEPLIIDGENLTASYYAYNFPSSSYWLDISLENMLIDEINAEKIIDKIVSVSCELEVVLNEFYIAESILTINMQLPTHIAIDLLKQTFTKVIKSFTASNSCT